MMKIIKGSFNYIWYILYNAFFKRIFGFRDFLFQSSLRYINWVDEDRILVSSDAFKFKRFIPKHTLLLYLINVNSKERKEFHNIKFFDRFFYSNEQNRIFFVHYKREGADLKALTIDGEYVEFDFVLPPNFIDSKFIDFNIFNKEIIATVLLEDKNFFLVFDERFVFKYAINCSHFLNFQQWKLFRFLNGYIVFNSETFKLFFYIDGVEVATYFDSNGFQNSKLNAYGSNIVFNLIDESDREAIVVLNYDKNNKKFTAKHLKSKRQIYDIKCFNEGFYVVCAGKKDYNFLLKYNYVGEIVKYKEVRYDMSLVSLSPKKNKLALMYTNLVRIKEKI